MAATDKPIISGLPFDDTTRVPPPAAPPDLKTLADAANEASKGMNAIWFFFLTFAVFLAVAVGSTTHRVLFLKQPIKLPVFGVDLPLVGFYWVAPTLFVILHFYVLVQLHTLAGKVEAFLNTATDETGGEREALRLQCWRLDPFMVTQLLTAQRTREHARTLRAMAWITLVLGPVVLLLSFQLRFLPYHDETTTWIHRGLLLVDLLLLWFLCPPEEMTAFRSRAGRVLAALGTLAVILFVTLVATIPDESAEAIAAQIDRRVPGRIEPVALLRSTLFGRSDRPFVRYLYLAEEEFVTLDKARLAEARRTVSLRGRDLRGAFLAGADLRKADFALAQLQGANFDRAQLQRADFRAARLQGTDFRLTELQGADFIDAELQGANFEDARLQGADFRFAELHGANFSRAQLQGAILATQLHGASFYYARLQGADFRFASAAGTNFQRTELQGADFRNAQLQGADFREARLQGAIFDNANLWRSTDLNLDLVYLRNAYFTPPQQDKRDQQVAKWLAAIPDGPRREEARKRLSAFAASGEEDRSATWHAQLPLAPPDPMRVAALFEELACRADGRTWAAPMFRPTGGAEDRTPYVGRSIIRNGAVERTGEHAAALARRLLDETLCPGTRELGADNLALLHRITVPNEPK